MLVFYLAALDSDDDKNKFEYIYRKYYRFMLHTAAGIIKNPTLAEDAVHETFVQLLRGIDTLRIDNERALKSYLYMVTRERSIDFLRKWERPPRCPARLRKPGRRAGQLRGTGGSGPDKFAAGQGYCPAGRNAADLPPDTGFGA